MKSDPKMGRPPLPEDRVKGGRIEIRVTAGEQADYEAAAKAASLDRSEWIRTRLNAAVKRESRK